MGWTKRQFVTQAFEEIGLASYVFDLTPEQLQSALRRLDAMGWTPPPENRHRRPTLSVFDAEQPIQGEESDGNYVRRCGSGQTGLSASRCGRAWQRGVEAQARTQRDGGVLSAVTALHGGNGGLR